jgi:hypothetical protein
MYHGEEAVLSTGLRLCWQPVSFLLLYQAAKFAESLWSPGLPSFFRFIFMVAFLAGLVYAGIVALATFVTPVPHEIVQTVPPARLNQ